MEDAITGVDDLFEDENEITPPEVEPVTDAIISNEYQFNDQLGRGKTYLSSEDKEEEPEPDKPKRQAPEKSAKAMVGALNFATSAGCSAISGRPRKEYKMDQDEKDEIIEPLTYLFESMDAKFHPAIAVIIALIAIIGGKLWTAREDYKADEADRVFQAKKKAIKEQQKKEAEKYLEESSKSEAIQQSISFDDSVATSKRTIKRTKRKRYTIDADGYYERNESGNYIGKEDREERPTAGELAIIEEVMMRDNWTEKILNTELKNYNKIK